MKLIVIGALTVLLVLTGCASSEPQAEAPVNPTAEEQLGGEIGLNDVGMPDWVFSPGPDDENHYVVGYALMANRMNSMRRAQAEARNVMAEWVSTVVDEVITTYTNDAGEGVNRQAVDAFETVSRQRAQAVLSGVQQEDMWVDADGGVYVLMSLPIENIENDLLSVVNETFTSDAFARNDAAEAANQMMNDAIAKYFGTPAV